MSNNEIDTPGVWRELSSDERSSTIAYFVTGWIHYDEVEVRVWEGVEEEGEHHIETHLHDEAPNDATHVIEVLKPKDNADTTGSSNEKDKKLIAEMFSESPSNAVNTGLELINLINKKGLDEVENKEEK